MMRMRVVGTAFAVLALAVSFLAPCRAVEEDTSLANLASHDGMIFFNGALRKTVPPNAPSGSPSAVAAAAVPCNCSDAAPRGDSLLFGIDCFHQRTFNSCNADYMSSFLKELNYNDGFCQMSCGRCSCCAPPASVLSKLGASRFLQAVAAVQPPLDAALAHPGFMATLLVPTDAAFDAALASNPQAMRDPAQLLEILKFHILPPEPLTRGLWTSPFMSVGATLYTAADGPAVLTVPKFAMPANTSAYGGLTGFTIKGPLNSAKVIASDIGTCKSYINVIDTVLMPFDSSANATSANGSGGLSAALGAPTCSLQANSAINGATLKDGSSNRQRSVGDCCSSCHDTQGCNAFR